MNTNDQCANCRHNDGEACGVNATPATGAECGQFATKINLEKQAQPASVPYPNSQPYPQYEEEQPSQEKISGWLQFFLIFPVTIGSIISVFSNIAQFKGGEMFWFSMTDAAIAVVYLITAILTLIAFNKRDSDAVMLAKTLVVISFLTNLVGVIASDAYTDQTDIRHGITSIIWSVVWFIYLCVSKQVRRVIPPSQRKSKKRDWIIIGAAVLVPIIGMAVGFSTLFSDQHTREESEAILLAMPLESNQRTDGRVIYTIPDYAVCEEEVNDDFTEFTFTDEETGTNVTAISVYDSDSSKKNFNGTWDEWKKELGFGWTFNTMAEDKITRDGLIIYYKQTKLKKLLQYVPVYWDFAIIFQPSTDKACVVSGYSQSSDAEMFWEIVDNLEFK